MRTRGAGQDSGERSSEERQIALTAVKLGHDFGLLQRKGCNVVPLMRPRSVDDAAGAEHGLRG